MIAAVFVIIILVVVIFFWTNGMLNLDQKKKIYKVGILNGFDYVRANSDGFVAGMTELGYIENENIIYDIQSTLVDLDEYRAALKKFVDEGVDLIFTFPTEASLEGKKIAIENGIPVIFSNANFEGVNLINTIKEPGNNLTGVRYPGPDVALKRFEVLMKIVPEAENILIPYDKNYPIVPSQLVIIREWAPKLGVNIIEMPVESPDDLEKQIGDLVESGQKIDALLGIVETVSGDLTYASIWGKYAEENKIPTGGIVLLKEDGYKYETLCGVDINGFASGKQAAKLADKVFKGVPAGTIPVESAEMFVSINYKRAKEMGIEIGEELLSVADEIIR